MEIYEIEFTGRACTKKDPKLKVGGCADPPQGNAELAKSIVFINVSVIQLINWFTKIFSTFLKIHREKKSRRNKTRFSNL
jgi:hypothetical protein